MATAKRDQILQEAEKLASRGKVDAAIKEYRRAIDQSPNDTNTLNRLGDLLQRANRIPEAIDIYQRIAEHFAEDGFFLKAIAIYKKINRLDPQRTEIYEKLADLYFKQGLVIEGRQQLLTLAEWFLRSKQTAEAVRIYRRLADLEPTNLQARAKLVDLLIQAGEVSSLAAEIDPLGKALLGRGMLDEAIKLYHRALDLKPRDCGFVAPCIDALVGAGRLVPAKELADTCLRAGPPGPDLARAGARAYAETGDLKTARAILEEVLTRFGERTDVVQLLADVLLRVGETAEAKERVLPVVDRLLAAGDAARAGSLIKRLLRSTPGDIDVLQRALKVFDRRDDPDMVATMEAALADAYFRADKREAAIRLYRELARQDPANRLFAQRLDALGAAPVTAPVPPLPFSTVAAPEPEVEFVDLQLPIEEFDLAPPLPATPLPQSGAPVDNGGSDADAAAPPPIPTPSFELPTGDALRLPGMGTAHSAEGAGVSAPAAAGSAQVTNAEELYTEAVVFAKYGLTEKAISHVHRLLALDPTHAGGRDLLTSLGGEIVEVDFSAPQGAPAEPTPIPAEPSPAPVPAEPVASPVHSRRGRVKLEELEAILGLGAAAAAPPDESHAVAARGFEMPEISFELMELGALGHARPAEPPPIAVVTEARPDAPDKAGATAATSEAASAPAPAVAPEVELVAPAAEALAEAEAEIEVLEEPVELVEVGDVLTGPSDEQLREIDFFIEQGLLEEAAGLLRKLKDAGGEHHDVAARLALLKARGWEEERQPATVEASADELFSEEYRFFDLAAELERELADEEIVAEATGVNTPGEVSIEELFREFQKGVAEQLRDEDYDTHFNLGIAYREMGLLDEAIREFQMAAKSPELGVEATSMIGSCYLEHGLPEQAAEWYSRALELPGLAAEVQLGLRYELGRAHEANGNLDGALASFSEVQAANPSFRDVVDRIARLKAN